MLHSTKSKGFSSTNFSLFTNCICGSDFSTWRSLENGFAGLIWPAGQLVAENWLHLKLSITNWNKFIWHPDMLVTSHLRKVTWGQSCKVTTSSSPSLTTPTTTCDWTRLAELRDFVDSIDIDEFDKKDHSHTPYVIMLYKYLQLWKRRNNSVAPRSWKEKAFKVRARNTGLSVTSMLTMASSSYSSYHCAYHIYYVILQV